MAFNDRLNLLEPIILNLMKNNLDVILTDFEGYLERCVPISSSSQKSYLSYVRSLDKANEGQTCEWLRKAVTSENPIECLSKMFDDYFNEHPEKTYQSQWKTGLMRLGDFICGITDSPTNLRSINIENFDLVACQMVAQTAVFCSKSVLDKVKAGKEGSKENIKMGGNEFGAWFHYTVQRVKDGKKGDINADGVRLDDNTYANKAIKTAVLKGFKHYGIFAGAKQKFHNYEACHIWPETCYDARYHTSVANVVLLPREVAGLTDYCQAVKELLQYEAWKRFGFKPAEKDVPSKPKNYNKIVWRN